MRTVDQMMERMGFPTTETGPYVTELRTVVARQISEGMIDRSAERARVFLEVEWEIQHGHSCQITLIDSRPIEWAFNTKTMRHCLRFRPRLIAPWLGDRWRELRMKVSVWNDRYILRRVNPYNLKS